MRIYKKTDWDNNETVLRIKPEGWTDSLVFKYGHRHMCGQAEDGIHVSINDSAGGVMTLDDLVALRDMINQHLSDVIYRKPMVETQNNCENNCE